MKTEITDKDVLIVIDPQNDFCPGGALAVPGGHEIIQLINKVAGKFKHVIITQDWHPQNQISFASNHEGCSAFDTIETTYGTQVLWPDHCVQNTWGSMLRADLDIPHAEAIIRKGYNATVDSYSAFYENDKKTATGLESYLEQRELYNAYFVGLAYDFCVGYSAIDWKAPRRFTRSATIIKDATRSIDLNGSIGAIEQQFAEVGVRTINSSEII